MHRSIRAVSKRLTGARRGEGVLVTLVFAYFFLAIAAYYCIKPVGRALMLEHLGSEKVPYADLVVVGALSMAVSGFGWLTRRVCTFTAVKYSLLCCIGITAGFWLLWPLQQAAFAVGFYVWVAVFSVLNATLFWLVANDLFRPRQAKRLFGFIGSGGMLGATLGSFGASHGVPVFGVRSLLLVTCGCLVGCVVFLLLIRRRIPHRAGLVAEEADAVQVQASAAWKLLWGSRYLLLLLGIVLIGKLISALIYYQCNPYIEALNGLEDKTTFTALLLGSVNGCAFVVQFCVTSWILRHWGTLAALSFWPSSLLAMAILLLFHPLLWVAALAEGLDRIWSYSLNNTAREVLYLPIDRGVRYRIKPLIDMVFFRVGKALAALVAIVWFGWGLTAAQLSWVLIPLLVGWATLVMSAQREYCVAVRCIVQAMAQQDQSPLPQHLKAWVRPSDPAAGRLLAKPSIAAKVALLHHVLQEVNHQAHANALLAEILREDFYHAGSLHCLQQADAEDSALLKQKCKPKGLRNVPAEAQEQLCRWLNHLEHESDPQCRHTLVYRVLQLSRCYNLRLDVRLIMREIDRERERFHQARALQQLSAEGKANPALVALAQELRHDVVRHVFRCLMLAYRAEDMHLIYEQVQAHEPYVREDALELLDNLVDPPIRRRFQALWDEDRFLELEGGGLPSTQVRDSLQRALRDRCPWVNLVALFLVPRFKLFSLADELRAVAGRSVPGVSAAARLLLREMGESSHALG